MDDQNGNTSDNEPRTVGWCIRQARQTQGISGYELGQMLSERFPPRTAKDMQACVYRWENYETGISLKNLIRVCTVLEMTIDELLVDLDVSTLGIEETSQ